jgi:DNA-binding CsgD family transcriptional regulator
LVNLTDSGVHFLGDAAVKDFSAAYLEGGWHEIDDRRIAARDHGRTGIILDQEIIAEPQRRRSDFFDDFSRAQDAEWCIGWGFHLLGQHFAFAALRSRAQGPFNAADVQTWRDFAPAAMATAAIGAQLNDIRTTAMMDGLEVAGKACVALDQTGRVIAATTHAERILGIDVFVRESRLRARDTGADKALAAAAAAAGDDSTPPLGVIQAPRADGGKLILIVVARAKGAIHESLPGIRLLVSLIDRDQAQGGRAEALRRVFQLSMREAQVASQLAAGRSPAQIAAQAITHVETVRAQIKTVFAKMNVSRQSEVAAIVAALPDGEIV